jgi:thioredoxin 1
VSIQLTKSNQDVLNTETLSVIKFSSLTCGPCQMLANGAWPRLLEVNPTAVQFLTVDSDVEHELNGNYHITGVPTVVFVKSGKELERLVGLNQQSAYQTAIDKLK